jgi:hypothetical protein
MTAKSSITSSHPCTFVRAAKIEDGPYGVNGAYGRESAGEFMVTFDFGPEVYPQFLAELP